MGLFLVGLICILPILTMYFIGLIKRKAEVKKGISINSYRNFKENNKLSLFNFAEGEIAYKKAKELFYIMNQPAEALSYFDLAIRDNIIAAYGDRAFCLQNQEYHYEAISDFNIAISIAKEDANLYYGRGHSKKIIMDYDGAIDDLQNAVDLSKHNTRLNESYNKTMQSQGWISISQFYQGHMNDALKRKKQSKQRENPIYIEIAREVKRRPYI